ncbi:hypothetical protein [Vibrio parahaemolyticus]|uniref:hypothetical protein n=1 Tax=Vibrio parahaemolyticus TaxID=670 RepID=UPI00178CFBD4|nr:hypothetical protein [Vibrio parahaemolyticus]ELP2655544.1 hypothetical protein [Vibrio parahaemolyticus]MBM4990836.1 hypothetical protein [Vibrio parahaemolyticus]MBM4995221.1 hypothetical protein [Vibrio parahaemolyticus]
MFNEKELRYIKLCLKEKLEREHALLSKLDEDSDEYMEKANDLMVLDSLIAKLSQ